MSWMFRFSQLFGDRALEVVKREDENEFKVDESALKEILLDRRVADTKIMIVSVIGDRGKGKSFLLNVFLKYLQNCEENDWMDVPNEPVRGFKWGFSNKASTPGLLMWRKPFFIRMPHTNEEVCVLLMDSQGYPQNDYMSPDYLKIFALSAKISSVQVYVTDHLKPVDLRHLEAYLRGCEGNEIQSFYFLIRNWVYQHEYQNGLAGGKEYIDKRLKKEVGYSEDYKNKLDRLSEKLKNKRCFMLPDPGSHFKSETFKGCLSDNGIEADFKSNLKTFTEFVLGPGNVVVKEIDGEQVTGRQLFEYIKTYTKEINHLVIPKLYPTLDAAENILAVGEAKITYRKQMNKVCGVGLECKPYLNHKSMESYHHLSSEMALKRLRDIRRSQKLCGADCIYENNLMEELQKMYDVYKKNNLEKNAARPVLLSVFYLGIFALCLLKIFFGYDDSYVLTITKTIMCISLLCFCAWVVFKLSGKETEQLQCNVWLLWNICTMDYS